MEDQKPKRLYVMTHAYHHFIVEVVEMLGPQRARVRKVRRIQSDTRNWTEFFRDGMKKECTTYTEFPDSNEGITWFASFDWEHEIL